MNRKLAYAIPNIFTAASLISALVALNLAAQENFVQSAWLITLSILLDGFDGKMARMLKSTSKIGAQADSLADFVAFGVVPAFLAWQVSLKYLYFPGFMIFILYVLCGGFRLARFNVMMTNASKKEDFTGLPIPAAAAAVSSFVLFNEVIVKDYNGNIILLGIMTLLSYLMVSRISYVAVTNVRSIRKHIPLICIMFVGIAIIALQHSIWVYFIGIWLYIGYGLYNRLRKTILSHQAGRVRSIKPRRRIK